MKTETADYNITDFVIPRYCYYKDTHKILGNTYGMLVLQVSIHKMMIRILSLY